MEHPHRNLCMHSAIRTMCPRFTRVGFRIGPRKKRSSSNRGKPKTWSSNIKTPMDDRDGKAVLSYVAVSVGLNFVLTMSLDGILF